DDFQSCLFEQSGQAGRREQAPMPWYVIPAPVPLSEPAGVEAIEVRRLDGKDASGSKPTGHLLGQCGRGVHVLDHVEHRYQIQTSRRDPLASFGALAENAIALLSKVIYDTLIKLQPVVVFPADAASLHDLEKPAIAAADVAIGLRRRREI